MRGEDKNNILILLYFYDLKFRIYYYHIPKHPALFCSDSLIHGLEYENFSTIFLDTRWLVLKLSFSVR
jgi:hypothetical protein